MANTASAAKRARQSPKRYARNRWYRQRARTFVKRTRSYIAKSDVDEATDAARRAGRALDIAAQKGAIHKNTAARTKSRLAKALAKLEV